MSKSIFFSENPQIKVAVREVRNSTRLSLRVSSISESVTLTAPLNTKQDVLLRFLESKESWIKEKLLKISDKKVHVDIGGLIPIFGVKKHLEICPESLTLGIVGNSIRIPTTVSKPGLAVENYLRKLAREELTNVANYYCDKLGVSYSSIKLRDTRSRWGSCSSNSNLMFSWRLIMAPKNIIRYLVAHEVTHLKHFNHSLEFWLEVRSIFGPYEKERKWLRTKGTNLHFYKFKG
tara:strand:- start:273 stop:974 length:702 start_codon:yes stop_codon:yes gene_type:complete